MPHIGVYVQVFMKNITLSFFLLPKEHVFCSTVDPNYATKKKKK